MIFLLPRLRLWKGLQGVGDSEIHTVLMTSHETQQLFLLRVGEDRSSWQVTSDDQPLVMKHFFYRDIINCHCHLLPRLRKQSWRYCNLIANASPTLKSDRWWSGAALPGGRCVTQWPLSPVIPGIRKLGFWVVLPEWARASISWPLLPYLSPWTNLSDTEEIPEGWYSQRLAPRMSSRQTHPNA